jgi:hypothetical protein
MTAHVRNLVLTAVTIVVLGAASALIRGATPAAAAAAGLLALGAAARGATQFSKDVGNKQATDSLSVLADATATKIDPVA